MNPITFDACFGWLHLPSDLRQTDIAVILCSGLRRDASNAYRPFRLLADQLAAAGYPALRFDYFGTGDSCDGEEVEYWAEWQRNILAASAYACVATGARRVVLIGLRIGAALATLAAAASAEVAGLILLSPVVRGKSYMTQFRVEARLRNGGRPSPTEGLALDELSFTGETVRQIEKLDLKDVILSSQCPVAIFSDEEQPGVAACAEIWAAKGVPVARSSLTGLEPVARAAHLVDGPPPDFTSILSWLRATLPTSRMDCRGFHAQPAPVNMRPSGCVETPLRFGENQHLFGILCRPDDGTGPDWVVVIGNPGGDPHHGYARFSVELSRRLARRGVASLRIDFSGLGDSVGAADADGEIPTHVFEVDRSADISAAFDALASLGYGRFAVHGLCSGAFHAFHAALADRRVAGLLLVNLPWFTLRHERAAHDSFARRAMAELSRRRVARFLLFAAGDAGIAALEKHFGPAGQDLCDGDNTLVSIGPNLDHDLTDAAMRRDVAERMIAFLQLAPSVADVGRAIDAARAS
jgi:pimeloyl-ACP methyl ester carboxylesterase